MQSNCQTCTDIVSFEKILDQKANDLVDRVNAICITVRLRNNERWKKFAITCNAPLIGNLIYSILKNPKGIEDEPEYYNEDWYKKEGRAIEKDAEHLEDLKGNHLEHWGEELVGAYVPGDYAGYYSPEKPVSRRFCYEHKYSAFIPDKY
ncbi:MAG: hypothetical protein AABY07_06955, partial [Nanoarchaeota archaeon]